jgi:hypothetical protein
MIAALINGQLARAERGKSATCPECKGDTYARTHNVTPHWAHKPLPDGEERNCSRNEMTEWHRAWQYARTDLTCHEVYEIAADGRPIKADTQNAAGYTIEFQHSPIHEDDVKRREQHWRKGCWVADGTPSEDGDERIRLERLPDENPSDGYWRFRWPRMPRLLRVAKWPVWVDLGERGLLQVKFANQGRGGGWLVDRQWFINEVINGSKIVMHTHTVKSDAERTRVGTTVRAVSMKEGEDLSKIPVHCERPKSDGPCCGEHYPGVAGEPTGLACQLCPQSPTYWRASA